MSEESNVYGGWAVDPDTLRRIANRWQKMADLCADGYRKSDALVNVLPPGRDAASAYVADKSNASGKSYRDVLSQLRIYCQTQADNCKKANHIYVESDEHQKAKLAKLTSTKHEG